MKSLNQSPIAFFKVYKRLTGNTNAGLLLSQLMYWFSHTDKFYKIDAEIMEETALTKKELSNAKTKLKQFIFLKVTREGIPAKTWYEIDWELYEEIMTNFVDNNKITPKGETAVDRGFKEDIEPKTDEGNTRLPQREKLCYPKGGNSVTPKGEAINVIQKTTTENTTKTTSSNEEKKTDFEFIKFLKNIRKEYTPNPDKKFYPNLIQVKSSETNEIGNLRLDVDGHLYATFSNHTKNLDGVDARHYWNYLFQHQDKLLPLPKLKQNTNSTGEQK